MTVPNPFHLPPRERARCDHVERIMAASGRYSTCPECGIEAYRRSIKKHPEEAVKFLISKPGEA